MQSDDNVAHRMDAPPAAAEPDALTDGLKPGTRLSDGQYTIINFLNSSGFDISYLAKDAFDRTIVIKECFPNAICRRSETVVCARTPADQDKYRSTVRLFLAEAHKMANLVHPNIVGVHQVFEDNETVYMAIDHANGKNLGENLDSPDHSFMANEIVEMLQKSLGAVEFLHQAGMLHRYISPDNIVIDPYKGPILINFGAASEPLSDDRRARTARPVMKGDYSPPEFYLAGSAQGPYSDLYSLGATFYHVIAGNAPPENQRRLAAVQDGNADPYQPLAGRFDGYPPGFLASIDKALKVLPRDRIDTATNWLKLIREGQAITARQAKPQSRLVPNIASPVATSKPSTRPILIGSAVTAALVIGLGMWMFVKDGQQPIVETAATADVADPTATDAATITAAEAKAAAKAEEEARRAAKAAAQAEEQARLAAEAKAAAKAEEQVRLAVEAKAAAQAAEQARLAAEAEATAKAVEEARLAAEVEKAAAAARAALEARTAALAAIKPRPALADTPVLDDQFTEVRWDYSLPFVTEPRKIDGDTFPVITEVVANARPGSDSDAWIAPGATIYAINGEWVADDTAIEKLMGVSTTPDEYGLTSASVRIRATDNTPFEQATLVAPTTRMVTLKNGTTIRTEVVDGQWRSIVEMITFSDENGILPDDVILGETNVGKIIDGPDSFEVVIDLLAFKSLPEATFDVLRNKKPMSVRMPLARQ